jgi:hypothetical protein
MSKCFAVNTLAVSLAKANKVKVTTRNSPEYPLNIGCNDTYIEESINTNFLYLQIDNHLNWKNHIDQLVPKLSGACYAVRSVLHSSSHHTIKLFCFAYFHAIMKYGIMGVINQTAK